ncbi:Imm1 family immunity protein [Streptomyces sp. NPDC005722]
MAILSVHFDGEWHHGTNMDEAARLVARVFDGEELGGGVEETGSVGVNVWFCLSEQPHTDTNPVADNHLRVAINASTGFGALVWGLTMRSPRKGGIYDSVWISDNPEPPNFDPVLVSDPGYPLFHDRSSALPIRLVREAVEEFCRVGTGDRPECVEWVAGHFNGQRVDRDSIVDTVDGFDDDCPF